MKRPLLFKMAVALGGAMLIFTAELLYIWAYHASFFPGNYESAYGILGYTALMVLVAVVLVFVTHTRRTERR